MTFPTRFRFLSLAGGLLLTALVTVPLTGCEEDVTAVLGTDQPFTLYGVLNPKSDTQWVRVFPIEGRLTPREATPLEATFLSFDLASGGEPRVWRDSVIQEPSGLYEHVFWSPFRADYGHTYRIEVARSSDDAMSHVEAEVPVEARLRFGEPTSTFPISQTVFIEGEVPRLMKVEVEYFVQAIVIQNGETITTEPIVLPYAEQVTRVEGGWAIPINLSDAHRTLLERLRRAYAGAPTFGVKLLQMQIRLIVANEDWAPPGGVFDPNVLVQPGTLDNVENGFGFVGAGYRMDRNWKPRNEVLEEAGFAQQADSVITSG